MRWIRKVSIADYFTLANGLLGFLAITYIVDGRFAVAYLLLFVAVLVDGIDGRLARFLESKHGLGRYIDSFSDTISFCFAPAILLYSTFYDASRGSAFTSFPNALSVVVPTIFLSFGIMRLARFAAGDYKEKSFLGLPTPAAAFLVINLCILFGKDALIVGNEYLVLAAAFGTSLLMISDLPYPKINSSLFLPSAVAVGIVLTSSTLRVLDALPSITLILTILALLLILVYAIGGPWYVKTSESEYVNPEKV